MDGSFIIHENPKIQPVFAKISFWEPYGCQNEKVCGRFYLMYDQKKHLSVSRCFKYIYLINSITGIMFLDFAFLADFSKFQNFRKKFFFKTKHLPKYRLNDPVSQCPGLPCEGSEHSQKCAGEKFFFPNLQFQLIFKTLQSICSHGPIFLKLDPKCRKFTLDSRYINIYSISCTKMT